MPQSTQPTFKAGSTQALVAMGCFDAGGSINAGGTPTLVHPPLTVAALIPWLASARVALLLV